MDKMDKAGTGGGGMSGEFHDRYVEELEAALAVSDKAALEWKHRCMQVDMGLSAAKARITALTAELKMERDRNKVCGMVVRENETLTAELSRLRTEKKDEYCQGCALPERVGRLTEALERITASLEDSYYYNEDDLIKIAKAALVK
jgi:hypothetical protein